MSQACVLFTNLSQRPKSKYNILQLQNQIVTANYNITKLKHISLKIKINILMQNIKQDNGLSNTFTSIFVRCTSKSLIGLNYTLKMHFSHLEITKSSKDQVHKKAIIRNTGSKMNIFHFRFMLKLSLVPLQHSWPWSTTSR